MRRTNNVDHLCQVLERSKREERRLSASTMCSARVYLYIVYIYKNTLFAKVAQNVDEESERASILCAREKQMQSRLHVFLLSFVRERNAKLHRPTLTVVGLLRRERSVSGGRAAHVQSRTVRVPAGAQVHQTLRGLQN